MLRKHAAVALLLIAMLPTLCAAAEDELTGQQVYDRITSEHPRLYFRPADLPAVRERCATFQQAAYERIKAGVDARLAAPGAAQNCAETALVYLVSGEGAYAEAGRRKLIAQTAGFRQNAVGLSGWDRRSTDTRRYIYLAADWLWQAMTPQERQQVADDLVAVARQGLAESPAWLRNAYMGGYNQWSNAFLCGALLAKSGVADDSARELFLVGYDQYWNGTMKARFQMAQDDGGIISGYNYAVYNYLKMELDFLLVMKNAAGADLFARDYSLRNAGIWFAYGMHMPWRLPKIADSGDGLRDFDSGSAVTCLGACAAIYHDPVAQKIAADLLANRNSPRGGAYPLLELLLSDPRLPAALPDASYPRARLFEGLGHTYMRAEWTPDATHAAFFCGDSPGNHTHNDVGTFLIYRGGELAADTKGRIFTTLSHNTLLLRRGDEGAQRSSRDSEDLNSGVLLPYPFPPPHDMADIVAFETNADYTYVAGDIARAYPQGRASELVRHFLWLVPNTFVIFDRVTTPADVERVWQLHCLEEPQVEGRRAVITASPRNTYGQVERGGRLFVTTLLPADAVMAKDFQQLTGAENTRDSIWRITVRPAGAGAAQPFLHVLYAATPGEAAGPAVRLLQEAGRVGAEVQADGKTYRVLFNTTGPVGGTVAIGDQTRELTTRIQPQTGDGRAKAN